MSEILFWKISSEGRTILKKIEEEKKLIEAQLGSGMLLNHDNHILAREYARKIGRLEGLMFIEEVFENERRDNEDGN